MAERRPLRVLIVDDEPPGRRRIEALLMKEANVEVVGSVGDGASAVQAIRTLRPDLVFLDVQMPKMTGLEVVKTLGADMPPTIFVTAYDKHAVAAFDVAAIDYLVKPFDDERFEQAFRRARHHLSLEETRRLNERLLQVLTAGAEPAAATLASTGTGSRYLQRIAVESKGQVRFIPVADVDAIVASGAYAELVVGDKRHLIRETMQELEKGLDPARFLRIHRSAIVAVDRVDTLLRGAGGDYEVKLKSGARLGVARSRRAELETRMGMKARARP
jgi:two-component system, LytTR family, response regulator